MLVLAVLVFASSHEVKKTGNSGINLSLVREAALSIGELALAKRVVDAGLVAEIMGELALVALGTVVLIVELLADLLSGLWLDDLPLDGVGEEAVEAVLAVAHVEVDAGVVAAIDMVLAALTGTLVYREVLLRAKVFDSLELGFQALVLQELLVVHKLMLIIITPSTHPKHTHTPKYHSANIDAKHINDKHHNTSHYQQTQHHSGRTKLKFISRLIFLVDSSQSKSLNFVLYNMICLTLLFFMMSSSSSDPQSSYTSGRSGGFSSSFTSLYQSTELKNWCYLICDQLLAPSLFLGSRSNSPVMKDFAFQLTFLGNLSFPSFMFLQSVGMSSEKQGGSPIRNSQRTAPIPYKSLSLPAPFWLSISGERQAGLPQKLLVLSSLVCLLRPKSASLMCPLASSRIFQGLRSLQIMFFSCRCSIARHSSAMQNFASSSGKVTSLARWKLRSLPGQQSSARYRQCGVWKAKCKLMMKTWLACLRMFAQIIAYFSCFCRIRFFFLRALRAQRLPFTFSLARKTLPNAPEPRVLRIVKEEKLTLFVVISLSSLVRFSFYYFLSLSSRLSLCYSVLVDSFLSGYLCPFVQAG